MPGQPTPPQGGPSPWGYVAQGVGDIVGGVIGAHAAQRAAEQQQRAAQRGIDYRQNIQRGISGQFNPYQQLGYGALMPLAALAGQRAPSFQMPQGRSFLAAAPSYGPPPSSQGPPSGGMPLATLGSGGAPPDWSFLQHATQGAQEHLPEMSGPTPGVQDSGGARNALTGGRKGDLVLHGPAETAYADKWLAENPGKNFGDADLHGYRNVQTAVTNGYTVDRWNAVSPANQKKLLKLWARGGKEGQR